MADTPIKVSLSEAELNALVEATHHADAEDIAHKNDRASARDKLEQAYAEAENITDPEQPKNHDLHAESITSKGAAKP